MSTSSHEIALNAREVAVRARECAVADRENAMQTREDVMYAREVKLLPTQPPCTSSKPGPHDTIWVGDCPGEEWSTTPWTGMEIWYKTPKVEKYWVTPYIW